MSDKMSCATARALAFDAHRGDLSPAERAAWRAHVAECDACAMLVERTDDMLDAASTLDADAWGEADADDLFARIAGAIDAEPEASADADVLPTGDEPTLLLAANRDVGLPDEPSDATETGSRRTARNLRPLWGVLVMAAAGALAALGVTLLGDDAPAPAPAPRVAEAPALPEVDEPPVVPPVDADLEALTRLAMASEDEGPVRVFSDPGASWRIEGGPDYRLHLDRGAVFVEFVGDGTETLRVQTSSWAVQVVGTAFYAAAGEAPDVRVLTGAVDIVSGDARTRVAAGERISGAEVAALPESQRAELARRVDPATHEAALDARRDERIARATPTREEPRVEAAPPAPRTPPRTSRPPAPAPAPAPPVATPPPADEVEDDAGAEPDEVEAPALSPGAEALARAEQAQRARRWQDAAAAFEAALAAEPGATWSARARLDVARIYLRHLGTPGAALPHLERFVAEHPSDVAAPAARDELCRVAGELGRDVAACAP